MADLKFENPEVVERIKEWTSDLYDEGSRREIEDLVARNEKGELEDRFYKTLKFGTGGLRGHLGAGTNRMNKYIVARATQGLANYVLAHADKPGPFKAAVTHDSRNFSRQFAETCAEVLAANGFHVYISAEMRPTPYLSFAVRHLECHTGIVVTASHNPKEYNGYKVYWDDGSQVIPPHDKGIIAEVDKVTSDDMVQRIEFEDGVAEGKIELLGADFDDAYLDAILWQRIDADIIHQYGPKIVYTPLHGVGGMLMPEAFKRWGFRQVSYEPEQMKPDGNFPTATSPNPEEGAALDRAIKLAKSEGAELVLATDPDADRLGIAVLHEGEFKLMTGNQLCALLADFILKNWRAKTESYAKLGIVSTIVTSPLVKKIADSHDAACPLVLTGFKWIASVVREWEARKDSPEFLYGTEESYGYLIGRHCRDKDALVAACATAEMAAHAKKQEQTLFDELYELYRRFGVHHEWQKSINMPGIEGARKIQALLDKIRNNPPTDAGGQKVVRFTRLDTGEIIEDGNVVGDAGLPKSDVFIFDMADGSKAVIRPSGTEPKIKFYFFLVEDRGIDTREDVLSAIDQLKKRAQEFQAAFLESVGHTG